MNTEENTKFDEIITELKSMNDTVESVDVNEKDETPEAIKHIPTKPQLSSKEKGFYKNVGETMLSSVETTIEESVAAVSFIEKMKSSFSDNTQRTRNFFAKRIEGLKDTVKKVMPKSTLETILNIIIALEVLFIAFKKKVPQLIAKAIAKFVELTAKFSLIVIENVPDSIKYIWEGGGSLFDKIKKVYQKAKPYVDKFIKEAKTVASLFDDIIGTIFNGLKSISGCFGGAIYEIMTDTVFHLLAYMEESVLMFSLGPVFGLLFKAYENYRNENTPKKPATSLQSQKKKAKDAMRKGDFKEAYKAADEMLQDDLGEKLAKEFSSYYGLQTIIGSGEEQPKKILQEISTKNHKGTYFDVSELRDYNAKGNSMDSVKKLEYDFGTMLNESFYKGEVLSIEEFKKRLPKTEIKAKNAQTEEKLQKLYDVYVQMAKRNKEFREIKGKTEAKGIGDSYNAVIHQVKVNKRTRQFITDSEVDIYYGDYNTGNAIDRELQNLSEDTLDIKKYFTDTVNYVLDFNKWGFLYDTMEASISENYSNLLSNESAITNKKATQLYNEVANENTKINNIVAINPSGKNELSAACRMVQMVDEQLENALTTQENLIDILTSKYNKFVESFTTQFSQ